MQSCEETQIYKIALGLMDGVGPVSVKKLVAYAGGIEGVFHETEKSLLRIPGIGPKMAKKVVQKNVMHRAEKELAFIQKHNIHTYFYLDANYPKRLLHCEDGPVMLYSKGEMDLNKQKVVSIIGTRQASNYGKGICEDLISQMQPYQPLIVSGMAYGVDICAHKNSLKYGLPTIGVMAHGLDRVYPYAHRKTAEQMLQDGGLLSEFPSQTIPDRENFPKRNRIIAGLSDATIVIESGKKGGSIITAHIAHSYNRDVFAVPGRIDDPFSEGCIHLIKTHVAALYQGVSDLEYLLGWEKASVTKPKRPQKLPQKGGGILTALQKIGEVTLDQLCEFLKVPPTDVKTEMMALEFGGFVRTLPGGRYALI